MITQDLLTTKINKMSYTEDHMEECMLEDYINRKPILFRPSEIHKIMGSARTKSNRENYDVLQERLAKYTEEYDGLTRKDTKKAYALEYNIDLMKKRIAEAEPMKDLPNLPETCRKHLKEKMIEIKYGRYKEVHNKYMQKGKDVEEDSITIYSLIKNKIFKNNKDRRQNEFFTGEIDLPWDDEVTIISDIKSSYDIHTFFDNEDTVKPENKLQGLGYMDLYPSCQEYRIANVLTDNTDDAILHALYQESYRWKDGDVPTWRELQIIKEHIYSREHFERFVEMRNIKPVDEKSKKIYDSFVEIPLEQRLIEHTFERDEKEILDIKNRIIECRLYMKMKWGIEHVTNNTK